MARSLPSRVAPSPSLSRLVRGGALARAPGRRRAPRRTSSCSRIWVLMSATCSPLSLPHRSHDPRRPQCWIWMIHLRARRHRGLPSRSVVALPWQTPLRLWLRTLVLRGPRATGSLPVSRGRRRILRAPLQVREPTNPRARGPARPGQSPHTLGLLPGPPALCWLPRCCRPAQRCRGQGSGSLRRHLLSRRPERRRRCDSDVCRSSTSVSAA
mmetsp:Transcript_7561/g.27745  ORF Transcript_7561/g.27745 Transcript_7561/m.27745 type:complete len:212 (-) Transcript_7561:146-781(-)